LEVIYTNNSNPPQQYYKDMFPDGSKHWD